MTAPRIDLNLLLVFEAVLETRSTTLAAANLGLTQSAVSNALNRLRSSLGDPLFVRTSAGMVPTPRAEEISAPLRASIEQIRRTLGHHPEFSPETSDRRFRIYMSDVGQMVLLPGLMETLQRQAPNVSLDTVAPAGSRPREAAMSSGDVDLALGYFHDFQGPFHVQSLFREHYVCMVRADSGLVGEHLDLEQYARLPHAVYTPQGGGHEVQERAIETALSCHGIQRRIVLRAAHFLGFTRVVASIDVLTTLPSRLAQACAALTPVRIFPAPFDIPVFEISQFWHKRFHQDPGNRWLRRLIAGLYAAAGPNNVMPAERDMLPLEDAGVLPAAPADPAPDDSQPC